MEKIRSANVTLYTQPDKKRRRRRRRIKKKSLSHKWSQRTKENDRFAFGRYTEIGSNPSILG